MALASITTLGLASIVAPTAYADYTCPAGTLRAGDGVSNPTQCNIEKEEEGKGLMNSVQTILNVVISVLGIVTVVVIIVGGVGYVTSQGDPAKATKARNTILYGVIGLVIALLAFAIVNFVLKSVFSGESASGESQPVSATHLQITK